MVFHDTDHFFLAEKWKKTTKFLLTDGFTRHRPLFFGNMQLMSAESGWILKIGAPNEWRQWNSAVFTEFVCFWQAETPIGNKNVEIRARQCVDGKFRGHCGGRGMLGFVFAFVCALNNSKRKSAKCLWEQQSCRGWYWERPNCRAKSVVWAREKFPFVGTATHYGQVLHSNMSAFVQLMAFNICFSAQKWTWWQQWMAVCVGDVLNEWSRMTFGLTKIRRLKTPEEFCVQSFTTSNSGTFARRWFFLNQRIPKTNRLEPYVYPQLCIVFVDWLVDWLMF